LLIQPLFHLDLGASVDLSQDTEVIRITLKNKTSFVSTWGGREGTPEISAPTRPIRYESLFSVAESAPFGGLLCRVEFGPDDGVAQESFRLLQTGAGYVATIPLDELVPVKDRKRAVLQVLYVIKMVHGKTVTLGLITIDEMILEQDENVVAVLDILGFTEIMASTLSSQTMDDFEKLLVNTILSPSKFSASFLSSDALFFNEKNDLMLPEEGQALNCVFISDTIILYFNPTAPIDIKKMFGSVSLLVGMAVQMGWLLRGAIEVGSFRSVRDEKIYFGTALLKAHKLELAQEWGGCILGPDITKRFLREIEPLEQEGLLVEYPCPLKADARKDLPEAPRLAVNWAYYKHELGDRKEALKKHLSKAPTTAKVKVENTIKFLEFLEKKGLVSAAHMEFQSYNLRSSTRKKNA